MPRVDSAPAKSASTRRRPRFSPGRRPSVSPCSTLASGHGDSRRTRSQSIAPAILTDFGQSAATLVAAAAGDFTIPTADEPTDHRYIHTVGPLTVDPHKRADMWVAVVSGRTAAEFFANVDAATADVERRQAGHSDAQEREPGEAIRATVSRAKNPALSPNPQCKRGCPGDLR